MKPFQAPYTMVHNYVIDHIMPDLSPNAWKVLCVAIRQTIGWQDEATESGRRESDVITYSQFQRQTGIVSRGTLSRALKECLDKGYLLREEVDQYRGKPAFAYRLNTEYEATGTETVPVDGAPTGTETVPVDGAPTGTEIVPVGEVTGTEIVPVGEVTGTETVPVSGATGTETVPVTGTEIVLSKEIIKENPNPKENGLSSSGERKVWEAVLGELQRQVTKAYFDTWVRDTQLVSCQDGVFVIAAQSEFARDWLEDRLRSTVQRILAGIVGHPVEVQFATRDPWPIR